MTWDFIGSYIAFLIIYKIHKDSPVNLHFNSIFKVKVHFMVYLVRKPPFNLARNNSLPVPWRA